MDRGGAVLTDTLQRKRARGLTYLNQILDHQRTAVLLKKAAFGKRPKRDWRKA
jgi:hypothetical protein